MTSMPECERCGNSANHGPIICYDCLTSVMDEVDQRLVETVGTPWTYAKDIANVIRPAFLSDRTGEKCAQCKTLEPVYCWDCVDAIRLFRLALDIFVLAQLLPGEGIEDGVNRIVDRLKPNKKVEAER